MRSAAPITTFCGCAPVISPTAPDAVLYPRAAAEVQGVLEYCAANGIAVVPYGGGTSVVGGVTGSAKGFAATVTLDLSGMDRLIDVDAVSGTATAEGGIYGPALEQALQAKGVTLGHLSAVIRVFHPRRLDRPSRAGQNSLRYGKAESWLVSAKLATPRASGCSKAFPPPRRGRA